MLICRKKLSTTYLVVLIMGFVPKSISLPKLLSRQNAHCLQYGETGNDVTYH